MRRSLSACSWTCRTRATRWRSRPTGKPRSERARKEAFDLILLDVMLPRKDGFEVCRDLRRAGSKTPIILLTAKAQEAEKVMGLELGADDYVTKPFSPRELRARVKAALRRAEDEGRSLPLRRPGGRLRALRAAARRQARPADGARVQAARRLRAQPAAALNRSAARPRVGTRHVRHRPGRGQPRCHPAEEDRAGPLPAALSLNVRGIGSRLEA